MTSQSASVDSLFEQVKSHIALHRTEVSIPRPSVRHGHFPDCIYDRIDEATLLADATSVQPFLTPARAPVIGALWQRLRLTAHSLVVFYVNRHAGAQMAFNRELAGGLREVVETLDGDEGLASKLEVAALRQEVEALQQRLAHLEQAIQRGTNGTE